jgi:hypothetical protein
MPLRDRCQRLISKEQFLERDRLDGRAEEKPLDFVAPVVAEKGELVFVTDPTSSPLFRAATGSRVLSAAGKEESRHSGRGEREREEHPAARIQSRNWRARENGRRGFGRRRRRSGLGDRRR